MCGIAGFAGNFDGGVLARMGAAIAHRGPDASGDAVYAGYGTTAGLANRRLAIQDLSPAGRQPMTLQCPACAPAFATGSGEAGEPGLWLTFNGEIYNFPELRRELESAGHRFFSRSDSEVILHLYAQHGVGMLRRLNGIFALAIYDGRPRGQRDGLQPGDVVVARDGVGVKPLYYSASGRGILFASEMKALLACGPEYVARTLDPAAISQYVAYQWVPAPRTVLASVQKVLPGEYLVLRGGRIASRSTFYELPAPEPASRPFDDLVGEFQHQLRAAVTRQLLSDVPIGAFLSGGLDSSAVVAMVREAQPGYRLPCYTMAFDDDFSLEGSPSDFPFAQQAARHLDVDLIPVHAGPRVVDRLDEVLFALDEPTGDPAPINAYLIAERAHADGLKVLLSGTGGDDILAGYGRHQWLGLEPVWDAIPEAVRRPVSAWARRVLDGSLVAPSDFASRRALKLLSLLDQPRHARFAARLQTTQPGLRARLLHPALRSAVADGRDVEPLLDTLAALPAGGDALARMLQLEQRHFLADHNLNYLDKTTMAFSVEGRVPLLDLEFVEFAATIPSRFKISGNTGKYIFKKAMEPFLPREVIYREKAGFGVPLRRWMTRDLNERLRDTLSSRALRDRGVFDDAAVQRLIDQTQAGALDGSYPLFSLLAFETWCRRFLDAGSPRASAAAPPHVVRRVAGPPASPAPPTPPFRATVSGLAGTHPLDLARQFAARNVLAAYYTSLPASRTPGVPPALVRRHFALLLPIHGLIHGWVPMSRQRLGRLVDHEFDRWASRRLVDADVAHAVAGLGLQQQRAAKGKFGALTVCDSGTTHARFHEALLDAEHAKWRMPPVAWDQKRLASLEEQYEESDLIVAPSRFAYDSFVARGIPRSKVALVPYGVDADIYRPVAKHDRVFRILFVGALSIRKGLPYLLEAVSMLKWRDAELTLRGGDTPESEALLRGYGGSIPLTRVPPQPRERLKDLYSSASVLVLPSIEDGFGLVIGQALACGTPVIASTHTGGPDVIEHGRNGLIIPPGDSGALRDALTRLRDEPMLLDEMRVEARQRVELARGWGAYGDGMVAAFSRALAHARGTVEGRESRVEAHGR